MKSKILVLTIIAMLVAQLFMGKTEPANAAAVKAFPGAMGFGTDTIGGRGGRVIYVTNLNDSGAGSFRDALQASGPRIVLFKVAGTITLSNDIILSNPYITIAGQTAPGEGVQIRNAQIKITTHDVIIRYLKVRAGDAGTGSSTADRDSITGNGDTNAYNIVVDHSTLIWGPDIGGLTFLNGAHDATVSNSIMGEGLFISTHPEGNVAQGGHSMAMNITELNSTQHPTRITVHHNLLTTSADRNPRIIGGENVDLVNNVVYNWQNSAGNGNPRSANIINNYYIKGPMNTKSSALYGWLPKVEAGGTQHNAAVYEAGNLTEGLQGMRGSPTSVYATTRFSPYSITAEDTPKAAYDKIVAGAGANLQVSGANGAFVFHRDSVDQRIINNLVNRTGTFFNGVSFNGVAGYPSISWPDLANGTPAADSDNDGMPDAWEQQYFGNTSRGSQSNSSSDLDVDGYTDLEEYLNGTNPADNVAAQPTATTVSPTATVAAPTTAPTNAPTAVPTAPSIPTPTPTVAPAPSGGGSFVIFFPAGDAIVAYDSPEQNFGSVASLTVDDVPSTQTYLKFTVSGTSGKKITGVKLRLYVTEASAAGGKLKLVADNTWAEGQITWKNRPDVVGNLLGKLDAVKANTWYEIDLTSLVLSDGTYSLRLFTPSDDSASYSSKEGPSGFAPQLVISFGQ